MKVFTDISTAQELEEKVWSGGTATLKDLTTEEIEQILETLEDCYPDGISMTELNDFLWFERDTIAEWLGVESYEELMNRQK